MGVSERERVAHVVRRLSMGVHPKLLADLHDTDAAIAAALDLSKAAAPLLEFPAPSGDSKPMISERSPSRSRGGSSA